MSPAIADRRRTARTRRGTAAPIALLTILAWGAFAFGAVYPWAYAPLAIVSAIVGVACLWRFRPTQGTRTIPRSVLLTLAAVGAAALLQVAPLPSTVVARVSPHRSELLRAIDLRYSLPDQDSRAFQPLSIDPRATLRSTGLFAAFVLLLAGTLRYLHVCGARVLATGIVVLGAALATVGIAQHALLGEDASLGMKIYGLWAPTYKLSTPFGPFVNRNHFAGWMLMAIPWTVGYLAAIAAEDLPRVRPDWRSRVLWLSSAHGGRVQLVAVAAVLMLVSLIMTRSRSGLASLLIASGAAILIAVRRSSLRTRMAVWLGALLVVSAAFAGSGVSARRFAPMVDDSMRLRREIWAVTLQIIRDFPLAGTGLDTFGRATLRYQAVSLDMHFAEAHNEYLQVAAEGGLLVAVPAAAAALCVALVTRRRFTQPGVVPDWTRFGAAVAIGAIALQSTVEFSLQMPGNAVLLVVLLGVVLHEPLSRSGTAARSANPDRMVSG